MHPVCGTEEFCGAPGEMRGFFAALRMTSKDKSKAKTGVLSYAENGNSLNNDKLVK
jgi:hypothetical protein